MWITLGLIGLVIIVALIYLLTRPSQYKVEEMIEIRLPQEQLFDSILDFRQWENWSPWLMHEPDAEMTYQDPVTEEGGAYSWNGKIIGAGSLTHQSIKSSQSIIQKIAFIRPFKSKATVAWNFSPTTKGTKVAWSISGRVPLFFRPMIPMIKQHCSQDYKLGLALLKGHIESDADYPQISFDGIVDHPDSTVLFIPFSGYLEDMVNAMETGFEKLFTILEEYNLEATAPPLTAYHKHKMKNNTHYFVCDMAVPVNEQTKVEELETKLLKGGKYYQVTLKGDYRFLELAWYKAMSHLRMLKLKFDSRRPSYEIYATDPKEAKHSNKITTHIRVAIK